MRTSLNGLVMREETGQFTAQGWLHGNGVFETIRTVESSPYLLTRHLQRAIKSAGVTQTPMPSLEDVRIAVAELLKTESLHNGLLRIMFGVDGQWGAVHIPYQPLLHPAKVRVHPAHLSILGESIKKYPYDHRLSILNEAIESGFDEALVINPSGHISECAVTNFVARVDGRWITPPTSDGVLPGIMRDLVIEKLGVSVASLSESRLADVSEAVLLSSLRIAQPIESINERELKPSQAFSDEIEAMTVLHSVE